MVSDPVELDDIPEAFSHIAPYIEDLAFRFEGQTVSEAQRLLLERVHTLHFVSDLGFVICSWGEDSCYVEAAYAFNGHVSNLPDIFIAMSDYVTALGKKTLSFGSVRKGWLRVAAKAGMRISSVEYTKEL